MEEGILNSARRATEKLTLLGLQSMQDLESAAGGLDFLGYV
jgi:hypothetical protein